MRKRREWRISLAVTAALILILLCTAVTAMGEGLGEPLPDFSVETIDGNTFTLSEALKDHDMVLINLWATWCGPCETEFPFLEEAYERYKDRVAVIALSTGKNDDREKLKSYAESHGLTFPIGSDTETGLGNIYALTGIPTSVVVDRFGNVVLVETGMKTSAISFTNLFDYFLDDNYTETTVLDGFPELKIPKAATEEELSAAANAEGSTLVFRNAEDQTMWPMLPGESGGVTGLISSNQGADQTASAVYTSVVVSEGDALAFEFSTSSECAGDSLYIQIDGVTVKSFTGEHDRTQWAIPLSAGEHEVAFGYRKDEMSSEGADCAVIANVQVISGEKAEALLKDLPVYPTSDEFSVALKNDSARRVVFENLSELTLYNVPITEGWIVNDDTAAFEIALTEKQDPELCAVITPEGAVMLTKAVKADGSGYEVAADFAGSTLNIISVHTGTERAYEENIPFILLREEKDIDGAFAELMAMYGIDSISWHYAE